MLKTFDKILKILKSHGRLFLDFLEILKYSVQNFKKFLNKRFFDTLIVNIAILNI